MAHSRARQFHGEQLVRPMAGCAAMHWLRRRARPAGRRRGDKPRTLCSTDILRTATIFARADAAYGDGIVEHADAPNASRNTLGSGRPWYMAGHARARQPRRLLACSSWIIDRNFLQVRVGPRTGVLPLISARSANNASGDRTAGSPFFEALRRVIDGRRVILPTHLLG